MFKEFKFYSGKLYKISEVENKQFKINKLIDRLIEEYEENKYNHEITFNLAPVKEY